MQRAGLDGRGRTERARPAQPDSSWILGRHVGVLRGRRPGLCPGDALGGKHGAGAAPGVSVLRQMALTYLRDAQSNFVNLDELLTKLNR